MKWTNKTIIGAIIAILASSAWAGDATHPSHLGENILTNPSFEQTEPPPPKDPTAPKEAPQGQWLPRTWEIWAKGVEYRCPDDPAQAHSGRRCVYFKSDGKAGGCARYSDIPIFDRQPWTLKVWARGKGWLILSAGRWDYQIQHATFPLTEQWKEYQMQFVGPKERDVFNLDITHSGPVEMWVDDVSLTHPALAPLNIVHSKPVGKDAHTLLYLPCETMTVQKKVGNVQFLTVDGNEMLSTGRLELSKSGQGRFDKSIGLWPGSTLVCSAGEHFSPKAGTIEIWIKPRGVRADSIAHSYVSVIGQDGVWFGKFIWGQINFYFGQGFRPVCGFEVWPNEATQWQPGVWRHFAAVWDKDVMEVFVDGKIIGFQSKPNLPRSVGDMLSVGGSNWSVDQGTFDFCDLRISDYARYKFPLPEPRKKP
jgi:hypothetical protein